MEEVLIKLGCMLIFLGFFLIFAGALLGAKSGSVKYGFGGFIGPIPFGFANDPRLLWAIIAISLVFLASFLALLLFSPR